MRVVLHFDYLHVGRSGPLGGDALDKTNGYVICCGDEDDLSNPCWLEPTGAYTARVTAEHLLTWCTRSSGFRNDAATHFKNKIVGALENALSVKRRFIVANSS